jgi:hypothetical protein
MTFPIRFECTSCGKCCTFTGPRQYVFVSIAEAQRIAKFSGLTFAETTERDDKGRLSLRCVVTPEEALAGSLWTIGAACTRPDLGSVLSFPSGNKTWPRRKRGRKLARRVKGWGAAS